MTFRRGGWLTLVLIAAVVAGGAWTWQQARSGRLPPGIASGNGRIEAVTIDVSARSAGRIKEILVEEGGFVAQGDVLARMDTAQLEAQRRRAEAERQRAEVAVETARVLIAQREAERNASLAGVEQREAEFEAARRTLQRSEQLAATDTISQQILDDHRASERSAAAAISVARAQVAVSEAAIDAARAQVIDAGAAVAAAQALIDSIDAEIDDAALRSPRDGRVQYRVAEPGEVVAAGGRVLSLVDLGDVYMSFFLPTAQAGRVAIGAEVRIVLDAAPQYVIPAKVTFVADVAQFTPKTVETEEERQKLMFRVKARISPDLLRKYVQQVKTGLPGTAHVRIEPDIDWPPQLQETLLQ